MIISIFVSLCTCTVLMWVSDVVRDYDEQRRAAEENATSSHRRTGWTGDTETKSRETTGQPLSTIVVTIVICCYHKERACLL